MSFSNPLAFNLSKSGPTTSTTNTSIPSTASTSNDNASNSLNQSSPKSPFLQGMFAKTGASSDLSNSFDAAPSDAAPTVLTVGQEGSRKPSSKDTSTKSELIDLFEKFDVSGKQQNTETESYIEDSSLEGEKNEKSEDPAVTTSKGDMEEKQVGSFVRPVELAKPEELAVPDASGALHNDILINDQTSLPDTKGLDAPSQVTLDQPQESTSIIEGSEQSGTQADDEKTSNSKLSENENSELNILTKVTETKKHQLTNRKFHSDGLFEPKTHPSSSSTRSIDIPKPHSNNLIPSGASLKAGIAKSNSPAKDISDISSSPFEAGVEEYETEVAHDHLKKESSANTEEQYQQSHKPFDFQNFLAQLKHKSADPVVRYIRSFLVSFTRQGHTFSSEQRIKIVREFKQFMSEKFNIYEPFSSMDDIDLENSREGLEKLIMNRIYDHCFPPEAQKQFPNQLPKSFLKDIQDDEGLTSQLERFSWVNGSHLDIDLDDLSKSKKGNLKFMDYAITELGKINQYRAPRDKIICLLNACKIIFSFLKVSNQETNADSFVPLLILVLIKAKTENLISNVHYIENFRGEEWLLHGETSYYLSTLQGAIGFIQNLSIKELTINEAEYNAHMEAWEAQQKQKNMFELAQPQPQHANTVLNEDPNVQKHPQQSLSPSNVLMTSAELFTKSISNFLSPSPQEGERENEAEFNRPHGPPPAVVPGNSAEESEQMKQAYSSLKEMFPDLDKAVLKDIIFMNKGKIEESLDACLQLVSDI